MKQIILFILIAISSFTLSAKEFSQGSIYHQTVIKKIGSSHTHVCHMNNIYLKTQGMRNGFGYMIWNNYTGSPLLCKDYQSYTYCLEKEDVDIDKGMVCFFKQLK